MLVEAPNQTESPTVTQTIQAEMEEEAVAAVKIAKLHLAHATRKSTSSARGVERQIALTNLLDKAEERQRHIMQIANLALNNRQRLITGILPSKRTIRLEHVENNVYEGSLNGEPLQTDFVKDTFNVYKLLLQERGLRAAKRMVLKK